MRAWRLSHCPDCSETLLTGESRFHISTPLGIWTRVPCEGKQTGGPLDQWNCVLNAVLSTGFWYLTASTAFWTSSLESWNACGSIIAPRSASGEFPGPSATRKLPMMQPVWRPCAMSFMVAPAILGWPSSNSSSMNTIQVGGNSLLITTVPGACREN